MERRDYWLLFGRTLCMALAVAVLAIAPRSEEEPTGTLAVFVAVKTTVSLEILWGPFKLMMHVASLRHWNDAGPGDYFGYPFVVVEWVLAVAQRGSASAAWGVITDPRFSCTGSHGRFCRRYVVSSGIAALLSVVSVANATVLVWTRMTHGQRLLELIGQ